MKTVHKFQSEVNSGDLGQLLDRLLGAEVEKVIVRPI